jgi:hypothetical protein
MVESKGGNMSDIVVPKWLKGVAVTTTILAVSAAIVGSRGTACVAQIQLLTSREGSAWAYYQAKSVKQNLAEIESKVFLIDSVGSLTAEQKDLLKKELDDSAAKIARYETEKNEIKTQAENLAKENAVVARRGNQFSLSVVFIQIGIMLSSVAALINRKSLWMLGLVSGAVGLVFMANGFLLFF